MQFYLSKVWKGFEVLNEEEYSGENAIFLGKTVFAKTAGVDSFLLEEDAYLFKRLDNNLIIAGGAENGLLNGVLLIGIFWF